MILCRTHIDEASLNMKANLANNNVRIPEGGEKKEQYGECKGKYC